MILLTRPPRPDPPTSRTRTERRIVERIARKLGFDPREDLEPRYVSVAPPGDHEEAPR